MKMELNKKEFLIHICTLLSLILISSYRIFEKPGLWFADEFGYSASAAFFAGMDWSAQISNISYYGVGYGFLLIPAYIFSTSAKQVMLYVAVLNVILLLFTFEMIIKFLKRFLVKTDFFLIYGCAMFAILYINNLVQLHMAWSETLNLFLYWLALDLVMSLIWTNKLRYYILLSLCSSYMVMVHMRNIAIVMAVVIILLIKLFRMRNKSIKQIAVFSIISLVGIITFFLSKKLIQGIVWTNSDRVVANDISARVASTRMIVSSNGLVDLLKSMICKYFYIVISTYGIIFFGFFFGLKNVLKQKTDIKEWLIFLYIILSFTFSFIMGNLTMMIPSRVDCVLYGRYFEPSIGAVLCLGIYSLSVEKSSFLLKKYCMLIISVICCAFVAHDMISFFENSFAVYPCISGIGIYFTHGGDLKKIIWEITLKRVLYATIAMLVFISLKQINRKFTKQIAILIYGGILLYAWIGNARAEVDEMVTSQINRYEKINPIIEKIHDYDITFESEENIYYLRDKDEKWNEYLLGVQFMLGKNRLLNVTYENWSAVLETEPLFFITGNEYKSSEANKIQSIKWGYMEYSPVCVTDEFVLYNRIK